jgi:hypothetical protein
MPSEIRQIAFEETELRQAVSGWLRKNDPQRAPVDVRAIQLDDAMGLAAVLSCINTGALSDVRIEADGLAAALVDFCIDNRIPLPRDASKTAQRVGDGVTLLVVKPAA